jgi:hypothetical protein
MTIVKNPGRFRLIPHCCAQQYNGRKYQKTNWLFMWWMIIFNVANTGIEIGFYDNPCCFMDGETRCKKQAEFRISENTRTDPDNFTDSCEDHVGSLLGTTLTGDEVTCYVWTVEYIGKPPVV